MRGIAFAFGKLAEWQCRDPNTFNYFFISLFYWQPSSNTVLDKPDARSDVREINSDHADVSEWTMTFSDSMTKIYANMDHIPKPVEA